VFDIARSFTRTLPCVHLCSSTNCADNIKIDFRVWINTPFFRLYSSNARTVAVGQAEHVRPHRVLAHRGHAARLHQRCLCPRWQQSVCLMSDSRYVCMDVRACVVVRVWLLLLLSNHQAYHENCDLACQHISACVHSCMHRLLYCCPCM
jgi:hypothetical protein